MGIAKIDHKFSNVFRFSVEGKLKAEDFQVFLPEMEKAVVDEKKKLRLLIDVTAMHGAEVKSEWEVFEFLKHHIKDIEYIAVVGAHSWVKVMSAVLAESVFVEAETRYFEGGEVEDAWTWLGKAMHPKHVPVRRVINSDKGLFTKYSSPDYI